MLLFILYVIPPPFFWIIQNTIMPKKLSLDQRYQAGSTRTTKWGSDELELLCAFCYVQPQSGRNWRILSSIVTWLEWLTLWYSLRLPKTKSLISSNFTNIIVALGVCYDANEISKCSSNDTLFGYRPNTRRLTSTESIGIFLCIREFVICRPTCGGK